MGIGNFMGVVGNDEYLDLLDSCNVYKLHTFKRYYTSFLVFFLVCYPKGL